jgi:hypothetical protein
LLAKTTPRNVNLGSVRFSMFNNQRDIPVVAPVTGYVAAAPYGLNGNGYGNGYGYGPPPPAYYNGDPVLSAYGRARLSYPAPRPPAVIRPAPHPLR